LFKKEVRISATSFCWCALHVRRIVETHGRASLHRKMTDDTNGLRNLWNGWHRL